MFTKEKLEELIQLDGGVITNSNNAYSDSERIGYKYREPSLDEQQEVENQFGVSYWSRFLLGAYAGRSSSGLNEALRRGESSESKFYSKFVSCLNEVLDELPPYENASVYRWTYYDEEEAMYLKKYIGQTIMCPEFFSASKHTNPSESFLFEIRTCRGSNCRDIDHIVEKEEHVLFKPNTVFKINDLTYIDEVGVFHLDEIKSDRYDLKLAYEFWKL